MYKEGEKNKIETKKKQLRNRDLSSYARRGFVESQDGKETKTQFQGQTSD